MARDTYQVARDHIDAVETGDPERMAADYAAHATLHRAGTVYEGREAIAGYFRTVPARLGQARVVFDDLVVDGAVATFTWHLDASPSPAAGKDVCTIEDGCIVHQVVHLDTADF